MRTIFAGLAAVAALFPSAALAQTSGKFNLECREDSFERGASRPSFSSRATYSVDLDRGLACEQSNSIVRGNLCQTARSITRSGSVISYEGKTDKVKIDLASNRVESASTYMTSRGTCTRTAFTPFPGDPPQRAATSTPADPPAVPGSAQTPAQPPAEDPLLAARFWVRDVVGQAASARGLAAYPASRDRCVWRFMPAAGDPTATGTGWVVDWSRTTRLPTLSSPTTVSWPVPGSNQVQPFRLAEGVEARALLSAFRRVIGDCAPAALGAAGAATPAVTTKPIASAGDSASGSRQAPAAVVRRLESAFAALPAQILHIMSSNKKGDVTGASAAGCKLIVRAAAADGRALDFHVRVDAAARPRRIAPQALAITADDKLVGIQHPGDLEGSRYKSKFDELNQALDAYWQACVGS